ncbi:hypothetical protein FJT64_014937 [Amphibalanus amphitrite]|uniref:Single domain-containing protein n=1 Tax=Amphibalanus amphitrite TaxID=1232801 RepID=A0A6A4XAW2_AMPAM|nr:uncharacterized protein LOC122389113 [Amphibalanus amphitrite]KAF0314599.1 hypothetical protein FJT64_014937 [Amphibalanus amphitrite]
MQVSWALVVVTVHLATAQHSHKYFRFPVSPAHENECHDPMVDKYFAVGEEWGPKNANCKLSRCLRNEKGLFIDRISCDRIRDKIDLRQVKERHLYCRIAAGDRRQPFPGCCEQLVCKSREGGRSRRLTADELPLKPDELPHQIEYIE